jgi:ribonucleoside-diphosphate reductase alpha chain
VAVDIKQHLASLPAPKWGFNGLGEIVYLRTYSRFIEAEGRSETWPETVERVVRGAVAIGARLSDAEQLRLAEHIHQLRGSVSGRALWQLGTPMVERFGQDSLLNCYYTNISTPADIAWLMGRLMVGGGVGFSVESEIVHNFPKVKGAKVTHLAINDADFIVPDSRQGWAELMKRVLDACFTGQDMTYSTVLIRPAGAPLKTFGGTASGATALIAGIEDIVTVINTRAGNKLRPVDVLDICNIIGRVVVAGSARRSAQIALGDVDDLKFLKAKRWSDGNIPAWRANSNNTLVANEFDEVPSQFWGNFDGNSEPYGLFNRKLTRSVGRLGERKSDASVVGGNPCMEIGLAHREACNLATIFLPNIRSKAEFIEVSTLLYKVQKATALLSHPDEETNEIVHRNMRLGQSLTGILQATEEQRSWVSDAYEALVATDEAWSAKLGVKPSVRLTAVQPSGTLSLLPGVTPGIHGAYAPFYIRRVRFGANDPLVEICRAKGYPVMYDIGIDGREDRSRFVVEFPAEAPAGTKIASEMSAVEQLESVVWAQRAWADNMVSVTITYRDEELPAIRAWLAKHFDRDVKSVSFLRYSDHGFALAPYEPIDEAEYRRRLAVVMPDAGPITMLGSSEMDDADCVGGACPVR